MLKLLKKLLGRSEGHPIPLPRVEAVPATPRVQATSQAAPELLQGMAQVEVAHLSLAAILEKLPAELKGMVAQIPEASVTVALPVTTIHKQLPSGSVKMSLASLYRQAPAGTFTLKGAEDRRMVEVPLPEIFRHVSPAVLRRKEQRRMDVPEDAVALFGNKENPYAMQPAVPEVAAAAPAYLPIVESAPAPERTLRPSEGMRAHTNGSHDNGAVESLPAPRLDETSAPLPKVSPPLGFTKPPAAEPTAVDAGNEPPLHIELALLAETWPEPIRSEALAMTDVKVALPAGAVTGGLAKGKIAFTWGQVRSWLEPALDQPSSAPDNTELLLPLKVVAPVFLRRAKPSKSTRKSYELDDSIPALFSGTSLPPEPVPEPEAVIAPDVEVEADPQPVSVIPPVPPPVFPEAPTELAEEQEVLSEPEAIVPPPPMMLVMPPPEVEEPSEARTESSEVVQASAEPQQDVSPALSEEKPLDPAVRLASSPPPGFLIPSAADEIKEAPRTLGEILGQPEKTQWSPPELVKATVGFPNVAGAIIALQEGFVVAAELPDHIKADTVAAFLPQIFARLNNYSAEMGLGEIGDLLTTTNGAQLQVHRFGEVYFAILGKTGEALPWEQIGPVVAELASQHRK